jgi:hypothetical protein
VLDLIQVYLICFKWPVISLRIHSLGCLGISSCTTETIQEQWILINSTAGKACWSGLNRGGHRSEKLGGELSCRILAKFDGAAGESSPLEGWPHLPTATQVVSGDVCMAISGKGLRAHTLWCSSSSRRPLLLCHFWTEELY